MVQKPLRQQHREPGQHPIPAGNRRQRFRKLRPDLAQMPRRSQHSSRRVPSPTAHRRCPVAGVPCASVNRRLQRVPLRCFLRRPPAPQGLPRSRISLLPPGPASPHRQPPPGDCCSASATRSPPPAQPLALASAPRPEAGSPSAPSRHQSRSARTASARRKEARLSRPSGVGSPPAVPSSGSRRAPPPGPSEGHRSPQTSRSEATSLRADRQRENQTVQDWRNTPLGRARFTKEKQELPIWTASVGRIGSVFIGTSEPDIGFRTFFHIPADLSTPQMPPNSPKSQGKRPPNTPSISARGPDI